MTLLQQFILDHSDDDVQKLALQASRYPDINMGFAVRQIAGRQKVKYKIPHFYQHIGIEYPVQLSLEQSSSESTALYKSTLCEGNTFADITGGFGVDFNFIAKKFQHAVYVERNHELCKLAEHNFNELGIKNSEVINKDAIDFLQSTTNLDMIYIDPARRSLSGKKVYKLSDCEPDVSENFDLLLSKSDKILIKLSPMLDLSVLQKELKFISDIHIISVENECKEILILIERGVEKIQQIKTINFSKNGNQLFDFKPESEHLAIAELAPEIKKYLYEPNASIFKAGAFKLIGEHYGMQKLHVNTHLYTSDTLFSDFPGRIFEIESVFGNGKADLKTLAKNTPKANIAVRNYPISVDDFRKKTGIKDGGHSYLFACKCYNDQCKILNCKKL